jgi:dolichol-phosphate mannosyltransferase
MLIILPAYNEGKNLMDMLAKIKDRYRILVIDDGSTDNTAKIAQEAGVSLIKHEANKGLGASLFDGFLRALEQNEDVIVTMDADNTMDASLIPHMADLVKDGHDIVIASRYQKGAVVECVPVYRKIMSTAASFICRIVFKIPVKDYSSGYRAYNAGVIRQAINRYGAGFITSSGFDCQIEILRKLQPFAKNIAEIPIRLNYTAKLGHSSFRFGKTFRGYIRQLSNALKEMPS